MKKSDIIMEASMKQKSDFKQSGTSKIVEDAKSYYSAQFKKALLIFDVIGAYLGVYLLLDGIKDAVAYIKEDDSKTKKANTDSDVSEKVSAGL